jgi:integrase
MIAGMHASNHECAPMATLTKRLIDEKLPGSRDIFVWDDEVRGFGLKLTSAGRKIFILQYRMGGRGTPHRYTIGAYGSLTPAQARGMAADLKHQISKGTDPRQAKIQKATELGREADPANTIGGLIDIFAAKHLSGLKSGEEVRKLLEREVRPLWGTRETARVTRRDVVDLLDDIEDRAGQYARNHATAAIRNMFNWATARDPELPNPTSKLAMHPVTERDRILSDREIQEIWNATDQLLSVFCPFMKILLLTAQRRNEVAGMTWSELGQLNNAVWTIPAARTKNGIVYEVPLSAAAMTILSQVPRLGLYVFTTDGETSISGFSKFKHSLDTAILTLRRKNLTYIRANSDRVGLLERWTLHDLRRTAATIMAKRGAPPHVVERILNHVSGSISGVAKIYNRHEYWDERRAAIESLGEYVKTITAA